MKLKGSMLDADGHLIERDDELLEYMEAPYKLDAQRVVP